MYKESKPQMNAVTAQTNLQFMSETPAADQIDWMADIQNEQRAIFAQMVSQVTDREMLELQDIQDEHDAIVAHAFAQVDAAIMTETHLAVCKGSTGFSVVPNDTIIIHEVDFEVLLAHIVGAEPIQGYVFIARGEAHSTFNAAVLVAATPKTGCTRGEPFIEWMSIDDFDFGNNGQLYIGDSYKQAAHAFSVWFENKIVNMSMDEDWNK